MKKIIFLFTIAVLSSSCVEPPLQFTEAALNEKVVTIKGSKTTLGEVIRKSKGKKIFIDVWASWCADCIEGMPQVKEIQKKYSNTVYVFLSVDKTKEAWKRGVTKYGLSGRHYFLPQGQKGPFGDFLNSNWIPRYMVLDTDGSIKLFKAKKASDERIVEALK
ncbi:TlpA family protein disulfide reductase [Ichthyenterobacterium sp. W332]|uniref:TlpA family protein disulfide reductase n=1 Tax=Microcosmobacter mediterraneus TaxID=3075607 RepID=A0ABU2YG64_9FLAO|nr:TlpA family protein disulfide reductase [Ichthyenterobacterium sp. W332]MDT0557022.1 TlpA family protein disulfide reductase [Ichthyenterobacterium sp. W332]